MNRTAIRRGAIDGALVAILVTGAAWPAFGEIDGGTAFFLDLTDSKQAPTKAKWSDPKRIDITPDGLGWGTAGDEGTRDFWLETTEPIGIGLSWRPTSVAAVRATVDLPGELGILYVRYSADARHWSTWQPLEADKKSAMPQEFRGILRVPYRVRARYNELRMEYARRDDVPWSSDEEALAREIVKREPKYFEEAIPFIGYVQFLYEKGLPAGSRIKGLQVHVNWFLGGKHHRPRDEKDATDRDGPWRFKAP